MKTNFKIHLFQCLLALLSIISLSSAAAADSLNTPRHLEATAISNHKIRLNWEDMSNNEAGFKIEMLGSDSNWAVVATTNRNAERFTVRGLNPDTRYYFRVFAFNSSNISNPSNIASAKTFPDEFRTPPAHPTDLTARAISPHTVKLEWNDNSFNEFAFVIEIKKHNEGHWRIAGMVRQNVEMYIKEGLQAATGYDFKVVAINPWGRGVSNIASVRTPDDSNAAHTPRPPSHLRGFAVGHRSIFMKWNDNSNNESGFIVERARHTPDTAIWVPVANLPADAERYHDSTNIEPGERYSYRVIAHNQHGRSAPSNVLTVLTPDRNIFTSPVIQNYTHPLSWQPVSGAESYRIEVAFDADFESVIYEEEIGNVTNYTIETNELSANEDYYLRVVGINTEGEDIHSNIVQIDSPTNISNTSSKIPEKYSLSQNYPNPFNPVTKIAFSIPANGFTKLEVYDLTGRMIAVLINSQLQAGSYEFTFDAVSLSSGIYFYKLTSANFTETKRMVLLK